MVMGTVEGGSPIFVAQKLGQSPSYFLGLINPVFRMPLPDVHLGN